jgi:hypothetical protein
MSRTAAAFTLAALLLAGCGQAPRTSVKLPTSGPVGAKAIGCLPGQCGGGGSSPLNPKPIPTCKPPRPLGPEAICPPGECGTPKPTPCR